jgi:hypothetical protein
MVLSHSTEVYKPLIAAHYFNILQFLVFFFRGVATWKYVWHGFLINKSKAVPLHATEALGGRGGIAPTHSRRRH